MKYNKLKLKVKGAEVDLETNSQDFSKVVRAIAFAIGCLSVGLVASLLIHVIAPNGLIH